MKWLNSFREPPAARVRLGSSSEWRLVIDFTATKVPSAKAVILSDLELSDLAELLRRLAPGTVVVIYGLDRLLTSAEEAARTVAAGARLARDIDLFCDCDDAHPRWQRRFIGNLIRFGCIERDETISDPHLSNETRHGRSHHRK